VGWTTKSERPLKKGFGEERNIASNVLKTSYCGIAVLDEERRFRVYDPGMEKIFGYTVAETPDFETWIKSVFPEPTLRDRVRDAFLVDSGSDSLSWRAFPFVHKNKETRWVRVHASATPAKHIVMCVEDITEFKYVEEALKTSQKRLEMIFDAVAGVLYTIDQRSLGPTLVNQLKKLVRTETDMGGVEAQRVDTEFGVHVEHLKELVEERVSELLKAERMAALGEAATKIAHDLRNPLQDIRLAQYLLRKRCSNEHKLIDQIERCVAYAEGIVENLLIHGGKKSLTLQETDVNQLLRKSVQESALPENVKVEERLTELPRVYVDQGQMKRLLQNLILNAVQAMENGGILTVESSCSEGSLVVSIQDTGVGIPEARLELIWRPFYTTKSKGIGLGLSVAKQIVEMHGGTISVKSSLGGGSNFTIRLPARTSNEVT